MSSVLGVVSAVSCILETIDRYMYILCWWGYEQTLLLNMKMLVWAAVRVFEGKTKIVKNHFLHLRPELLICRQHFSNLMCSKMFSNTHCSFYIIKVILQDRGCVILPWMNLKSQQLTWKAGGLGYLDTVTVGLFVSNQSNHDHITITQFVTAIVWHPAQLSSLDHVPSQQHDLHEEEGGGEEGSKESHCQGWVQETEDGGADGGCPE